MRNRSAIQALILDLRHARERARDLVDQTTATLLSRCILRGEMALRRSSTSSADVHARARAREKSGATPRSSAID